MAGNRQRNSDEFGTEMLCPFLFEENAMNDFELLAPAGSLEILKAVIDAGADAVYLAGNKFGARAYANNFTEEELLEALDYAHLRKKKIYLTVNTLLKNDELACLEEYLGPLYLHGLDAVLVQDFGVLCYIHEHFPKLDIHTSTQMTVTGVEGVRFLQQYGVTRVVMAREMSIEEMRHIHEETGMELEAFVHGALCYSYSGQCLFSSMLGGRSGNRGRCAQPCRLSYRVLDANQKEIKKDSYILSLKDCCGIEDLAALREAGVYSLKIEGRMKQLTYAAGVVSVYRKYVDEALNCKKADYMVKTEDKKRLLAFGSRAGVTNSYFYRQNGPQMVTYEKPSFTQTADEIPQEPCYLPVSGSLVIQKDAEMLLSLTDGTHAVCVTGPIPQPAQKQPLIADEVKKRMQKTRDTAFWIDALEVTLDDGLFVPNGALNQLKRDGIDALTTEILREYHRTKPDASMQMSAQADAFYLQESVISGYSVSLENRSLLDLILPREWVERIYMDSSAYEREAVFDQLSKDVRRIHGAGKMALFILPAIFRRHTSHFFAEHLARLEACGLDGFVVKNYEAFAFVKANFPDLICVADHNLYTYNDRAQQAFLRAGANYVTMPLELNKREIANRKNNQTEMLLYGYYPLMTSAQCVCHNSKGCQKTPQLLYLKDRYQKLFPVRNVCADCYNVIYNSLPTMLFAHMEELEHMGVHAFRLHFSVEEAGQAAQVLELFEGFVNRSVTHIPQDFVEHFTNGHYKRGVE